MCLLALMGALMFVMQVAMAPIRNFHMTDVLIILTAIFFGWKVMYSVFVFVVLEGLMWGFGLWVVSYMYLWPILAAVAVAMRKTDSSIVWAIVAALHGLFFGAGSPSRICSSAGGAWRFPISSRAFPLTSATVWAILSSLSCCTALCAAPWRPPPGR